MFLQTANHYNSKLCISTRQSAHANNRVNSSKNNDPERGCISLFLMEEEKFMSAYPFIKIL